MSFSISNLGQAEQLARAIGLVNDSGFNDDWLSNPGDYLASALSNDAQRAAILAFVDDALGGGSRRTDALGQIWLPLFDSSDPPVAFSAVIDEHATGHIRVGLGVEITSQNPQAAMRLHLPLFKAGRGGSTVANPLLLGQPGGSIGFSCDITVDDSAPQPGQAHLRAIGLLLTVPTDGSVPDFGVTLSGLRLPGATSGRDIALSVANVAELDDIVLDLVLGLLEAQARQAGGAVQAFARLIGLSSGTAIPQLPLEQLPVQGVGAIAGWAAEVFASPAARTAWLGELRNLLGGGATANADRVELPFGIGRVTLGVNTAAGSGGLPVVTPVLGIETGGGQAVARVQAELFRLDLGNRSAAALPSLDANLLFGKTPSGGAALLAGDPAVDAIRFGISLDQNRRPAATLALINVKVGAHPAYPILDLSSPSAVVESAGQVIGDVLDQVLSALGPAQAVLRTLFGFSVPAGIAGLQPTLIATFLRDPLAAVRTYWKELVLNHAAGVPLVLAPLRGLIADQGVAATAIGGTGTVADPWTLSLVGPVELRAWKPAAGNRLEIAVAAAYMNDQLGERCTRLDADFRIGLVTIDLDGGAASFLNAISAGISGRPRGARRAAIEFPPLQISADSVGLEARWTPQDGVKIGFSAPNPAVAVNNRPIPLDIPDLSAGLTGLNDAQWDAVELLAGQLARLTPESWVMDLVDALGWAPTSPLLSRATRPRLRLAALVADPQAAILEWMNTVVLVQSPRVRKLLMPLARVLTGTAGSFGRIAGRGSPVDPFRVALTAIADAPELSLWVEPDGPPPATFTGVTEALAAWRPGQAGLSPFELADAMLREAMVAPNINGILSGRANLATGLADLYERWAGTDGRILAPLAEPAGITARLIHDAAFAGLGRTLDLAELLGALPATVIRIAVVAAGTPAALWPDAPPERIIDLTAPSLAPAAFALPTATAGEWFVALGPRAACRLASGDADGLAGQAGRLERILQPFRALAGDIALVAEGGAGHAARRVAETVVEIDAVVMLGTPVGPVAFSILTSEPAASTLRLLGGLIPADDPAEPFDDDLALGRDLVRGLSALAETPAMIDDLAPPASPFGAPRAGLALHGLFGTVTPASVARAVTAIVAAGLSTRARTRATRSDVGVITGMGAGISLPLSFGVGTVLVTGQASVELFGANLSTVPPQVRQSRPLTVHLEIHRADGWLVGGTGTTSGQHLRWLEFNLSAPLGTGGKALAELVLHEAQVFSVRRERWVVRHAGATVDTDDVVTPALPEVGVLLSGVLRELSLDTDTGIAAFLNLLEVAGVFSLAADSQGGFVASALDSILNQPDVHFRTLLANLQSRQALQAFVDGLAARIPGLSVDLAQKRVAVALSGTPGTVGLQPWSLSAFATAAGAFDGEARLGATGSGLHLSLDPLTLTLDRPRSAGLAPDIIQIWPQPDLSRLVAQLPPVMIATAIRLGLEHVRELDDGARPVIDAALDALGLLGNAATDVERPVRVPLTFLTEPVAWFRNQAAFGDGSAGFAPARVIGFVNALKPLLALPGASGEIQLASGVAIAVSGTAGALRLGVTLDGSAFAAPAAAPARLAFGGTIGLEIGSNGTLRPAIDVFAGLPGAAAGRQAVHLVAGQAIALFIRPAVGPDIGLYPNPPGLGSVAGAAMQVLPFVLDKIAALANPPAAASAALVVRTLGDALDLRSGGPAKFDAAKLAAWAANPAQRFADRLPTLAQPVLTALVTAIGPLLPAGLAVTAPSGRLLVAVGPVEIDLATAPFQVQLRLDAAGVPVAGRIGATISFDAIGLVTFSGAVGPAMIPVGGAALRPLVRFAAGRNPAGGARIEVGGAIDAAGTKSVVARWNIASGIFALVVSEGTVESTNAEAVAVALVRIALDLVAQFAMQAPAVQTLLDKAVPHATVPTKVRDLFKGVFLENTPAAANLDAGLFDPPQLLGRFMRLLRNAATAGPSIAIGDGLGIGVILDGSIVKLTLGVNGRVTLNAGDVTVSIEADSRWILNKPPAGLSLGFLNTAGPSFEPSLSVNGIGVRIGRTSGPLVDSAIKLGSVAAHFFADIAVGRLGGGVQIELSELAVGAAGAGGDNAVAQGVMGDTGSGKDALAPAFSPALAVQKHSGGPVLVSLSAGEGDGPWWLSIQKGFGPLYVEQVGFGVTVRQDQLEKISVLFDGRVSIAGLVASVDDLQITFTVTSGASLFNASNWIVDLAGLAVSADIAGVTLAGGLRKFSDPPATSIEYVGMLMARVATYGLSIYGGYGSGVSEDGVRFSAFFAFGAVIGPIGGPPAFFVTGIGGGFGINRDLIFPPSLQTFSDFVMIRALDPSAPPSTDPMGDLAVIRGNFPMRRDRFWFAAGLSFTSFALVDGIAVIAVSFGGGFELTLLGLARMALPRPQFRLVSIELGLMARFSSRDGVMWIQAELTENSWLLHESVRLTGGFAYVMWFSGERAGEFVLTLGGYHPNFHRDGYPQVPRLGFRWQPTSFISIKGENYFALTSEALMAGGALEASAKLGPAWANVSFGANAIIYFDPFRYEADAHARISAGVTIDLWLGEITISVSLGAQIAVSGPEFHGRATFEIGPIDVTFEFGSSNQSAYEPISWEAFVTKYLEAASPGVARLLTAMPGKGSVPPGTGTNGEEKGVADGSPARPFEVFSEFELTVTTIAPATSLTAGATTRGQAPSRALGIAPVGDAAMSSAIALHLYPSGSVGNAAQDKMGVLRLASTSTGAFPVGAWGPQQPRENKKVPAGEIIEAMNGALFVSEASIQDTLSAEVDYNQVEAGPRKPLPFVTERNDRARVVLEAGRLTALLPAHISQDAIYQTVRPWMADAGNSELSLVSLRGDRAAPPMLGTLAGRMASRTPGARVNLTRPDPSKTYDHAVRSPKAVAILSPLLRRETVVRRTTVKSDLPRVLPPSFNAAEELVESGLPAKLMRLAPQAVATRSTLVATGTVPMTRRGRMAPAAADGRGADRHAASRLKALTTAVAGREARHESDVQPGEVAVLAMPNARRDAGTGPRPAITFTGNARIVMLGAGGTILSDSAGAKGKPAIPQGTERIAVWAGGPSSTGLSGWHDGQSLAYVGWATSLCAGGSVHAENARIRRGPESFKAGWIGAKELVEGSRLVTTTFTAPVSTVVLLLDELAPGDSTADFSLSLEGASVAKSRDGSDLAPIVLSSGARRVLVYAVSSDGKSGVTVAVARDGSLRVAGVMGATADAALVAAMLTEQSPETLLDMALPGPDRPVSLAFVAAKRQAAKRQAAKGRGG